MPSHENAFDINEAQQPYRALGELRRAGMFTSILDLKEGNDVAAHDLVLCRDVLTELPLAEMVALFNRIRASGARFVAVTQYWPELNAAWDAPLNGETPHGQWRPINLRRAPFCLPAPLFSISDNAPGKTLDVWACDALPELSAKTMPRNPSRSADFLQYEFYRRLCALPFIEKMTLYGSRARGNFTAESDIDLLIHCVPGISRRQWLEVCAIIRDADIPLPIDCLRHADSLPSMFDDYAGRPLDEKIIFERETKPGSAWPFKKA